MRCRRAFTLVELLVVIAIIGILAALLLSVLNKAKQRAHLATDVNNNRQILLATHMYAGDQNDYLPRPGWKIPFSNWAYGDPFPYGNRNYDAVIEGQLAAVTKGQLYPYYQTAKILMCPADHPDSLFYEREMYISSYIWNGAVSSYDTLSEKTHRLAQFRPQFILQWESDEMNPISFNNVANLAHEGFTRRHGGSRSADPMEDVKAGVTIGFFDGSAKRMQLGELSRLSGKLGAYYGGPPVLPDRFAQRTLVQSRQPERNEEFVLKSVLLR